MADLTLMNMIQRLVTQATFMPVFGQEVSGLANGALIAKELRPTYWRARLACDRLTHDQAMAIMAIIGSLQGSINTLYVWNPLKQYPVTDPDGSILGSSNVQINALGPVANDLSLKGLPAGFVLSRGDMLSFVWGTTHVALHQVVDETVTANGSGVTPTFKVAPYILSGAAVDAVVTLKRSYMESRLVPNGYDGSGASVISQASLDFVQVL